MRKAISAPVITEIDQFFIKEHNNRARINKFTKIVSMKDTDNAYKHSELRTGLTEQHSVMFCIVRI